MPRAVWPLKHGRPRAEIVLVSTTGLLLPREVVADSGAGSIHSPFELILNNQDCLSCGADFIAMIQLRGAFAGTFPLYTLRVQVPPLSFDDVVEVVGAAMNITGFDGLAG